MPRVAKTAVDAPMDVWLGAWTKALRVLPSAPASNIPDHASPQPRSSPARKPKTRPKTRLLARWTGSVDAPGPGVNGEVEGFMKAVGKSARVSVALADEGVGRRGRAILFVYSQYLALGDAQVLRQPQIVVSDGHVQEAIQAEVDAAVGVEVMSGSNFGEVAHDDFRLDAPVVLIGEAHDHRPADIRGSLDRLSEEGVNVVVGLEVRV